MWLFLLTKWTLFLWEVEVHLMMKLVLKCKNFRVKILGFVGAVGKTWSSTHLLRVWKTLSFQHASQRAKAVTASFGIAAEANFQGCQPSHNHHILMRFETWVWRENLLIFTTLQTQREIDKNTGIKEYTTFYSLQDTRTFFSSFFFFHFIQ